jgi:hypothetical protein
LKNRPDPVPVRVTKAQGSINGIYRGIGTSGMRRRVSLNMHEIGVERSVQKFPYRVRQGSRPADMRLRCARAGICQNSLFKGIIRSNFRDSIMIGLRFQERSDRAETNAGRGGRKGSGPFGRPPSEGLLFLSGRLEGLPGIRIPEGRRLRSWGFFC